MRSRRLPLGGRGIDVKDPLVLGSRRPQAKPTSNGSAMRPRGSARRHPIHAVTGMSAGEKEVQRDGVDRGGEEKAIVARAKARQEPDDVEAPPPLRKSEVEGVQDAGESPIPQSLEGAKHLAEEVSPLLVASCGTFSRMNACGFEALMRATAARRSCPRGAVSAACAPAADQS